jgi:hypothetical protein
MAGEAIRLAREVELRISRNGTVKVRKLTLGDGTGRCIVQDSILTGYANPNLRAAVKIAKTPTVSLRDEFNKHKTLRG